jgi:LEA14-like dessication related protein
MHRSLFRLLLIGGQVVLVLWLVGCATLPATTEPPYLSIISIEPLEISPLEQKYRLKLRVQNPNDHALDIAGMSYILEINGQPFLKGVSSDTVTVPRYGESIIELSGVSTLFGFVQQIRTLQQRQGQDMEYKLSGKLSLSGGISRLPFSYEGSLLHAGSNDGGS